MAEEQPPVPTESGEQSAAQGDASAGDSAPALAAAAESAAAPADVAAVAESAAPAADAIATSVAGEAPAAAAVAEEVAAKPEGGGSATVVAEVDPDSIEALLQQGSFEDVDSAGVDRNDRTASIAAGGDTEPFDLPDLGQVMRDAHVSSVDLLRDVDLNVKIELGRTRMLVEDVLKLGEGMVVELDKLAGDPVDVFVNERLVARGEVLVLNDNFCVRINEIVAGVKEEGM